VSTAVEVHDLVKSYGALRAVDGLSDVSFSSAAKNAGGTDGRGAGGIELGMWYTGAILAF